MPFCHGDLCFIVTGREESFRDAVQDDDRRRKRAENGQADSVVSETKGDDRECERGEEPQKYEDQEYPLLTIIGHKTTYLFEWLGLVHAF